MSNYELEEVYLLKWQAILSFILIGSLILSLALTYNEILKYEKKQPLFNEKEENDLLVLNRSIAFITSLAFLWINVTDKNIKIENDQGGLKEANIQIWAGVLSLLAAILVLYVSLTSSDNVENPED